MRREEKRKEADQNIKGIKWMFLCLLQDIEGMMSISLWEYLTLGSPHWVSGYPQQLKCSAYTSTHPVSGFLGVLLCAAVRASGVIGVLSDKQIRDCGQGRHHKLELNWQLSKKKKGGEGLPTASLVNYKTEENTKIKKSATRGSKKRGADISIIRQGNPRERKPWSSTPSEGEQ